MTREDVWDALEDCADEDADTEAVRDTEPERVGRTEAEAETEAADEAPVRMKVGV